MSWRHSRKRAPRRLRTQRLQADLPPARHMPQRSAPAEVQTHSVQVERPIVAPVDRMPAGRAQEEVTMPADQAQEAVTPAEQVQAEATPADPERAVAIGRQRERRIAGPAARIVREQAETTRIGPERAEITQTGRERIIGATVARMPIVLVARTQTIAAEQRAIVISRQVPGTLH